MIRKMNLSLDQDNSLRPTLCNRTRMPYFCGSSNIQDMAIFNAHQIKEINEVIAEIDKSIKPKCEIGAHDKPALTAILKTQNLKKKVTFFPCKREYSDTIVTHFVKEKGIIKNRFHKINQAFVFILK